MKSFIKSIYCLVILASISSCSSSQRYLKENDKEISSSSKKDKVTFKDINEIPQFSSYRNHVAPGFLFKLSHPSDERLRGKFRVDFDGILRLPYNVKVKVTRKTYTQVKSEVMTAYKKFFQKGVRNVSFTLVIRNYYIEVRGFVKKPGRYLVTRKESIDKVLDRAGGIKGSLKNDLFSASIKQSRQSYTVSLNQYFENDVFANSFTWVGGDTIFVKELSDAYDDAVPMVTILGGVAKPGKVLYKNDANIFYYLSKSGGTIQSVSYEHAYIIRKTSKGLKNIHFDLRDMKKIPAIQANDTVMLSAERQTALDRFLARTSQVASIIVSFFLITLAL